MSNQGKKAKYELERIKYRQRVMAAGHTGWLTEQCRKRRFKEQKCGDSMGYPPGMSP